MTIDDIHDHRDPILPGEDEREALAALQAFLESDGGNSLALVGSDGEQVALPASATRALRRSVAMLATERAVSQRPVALTLSPRRVAEFLDLSIGEVLGRVSQGDVPTIDEDGECRIRLSDVLRLRRELSNQRRQALDEMLQISQELGIYE